MRLAKCVLTGLAALYAFPAAAQGMIEFESREEMFSINLPHAPAVENIVYRSEFGRDVPGIVFSAAGGNVDYRVTVVNYADTDLPGDRGVWDFAGAVAYAAWNIRKRGGEVTQDGWTEADRIQGHQLHITAADGGRTYAAMYSHGTRLYILEAIAAPGATAPIQFQQSLSILDEDGDVIRYDTDFITRIDSGR